MMYPLNWLYRGAYKLLKEIKTRKTQTLIGKLCDKPYIGGILVSLFTGDKLIVDPCDAGLSVDLIINRGVREACSVKEMLKLLESDLSLRKKTFLDIGANIGYFTVLFGKFFNKVISVEPIDRAVKLLKTNVLLNGLEKPVEIYPVAVSKDKKRLTMIAPKELNLSKVTSGDKTDNNVIVVDSAPLREFIEKFSPVGLLKIDVEGYEWELFGDELPFNEKNVPDYIYLELHTKILGKSKSMNIIESLSRYYDVYAICFEPNLNSEPFMTLWKKFLGVDKLCIERAQLTGENIPDVIEKLFDTILSPKKVYAPRFILKKKE